MEKDDNIHSIVFESIEISHTCTYIKATYCYFRYPFFSKLKISMLWSRFKGSITLPCHLVLRTCDVLRNICNSKRFLIISIHNSIGNLSKLVQLFKRTEICCEYTVKSKSKFQTWSYVLPFNSTVIEEITKEYPSIKVVKYLNW